MIKYSHHFPPRIELVHDQLVRKKAKCSTIEFLNKVESLIQHLMINPNPLVVHIIDYKFIGHFFHEYEYSYDMMRLGLLSKTEKMIINTIGDIWDNHKIDTFKNLSDSRHAKFLFDSQVEYSKLFNFLQVVIEETQYWDLHSGNVLIDLNEDYKLIDIEGFLV